MHTDIDIADNVFAAKISLLEFLAERGWRPLRDEGREEVAGLCPLHKDSHPSFYVNRRKQVFYCHGCGTGGGLRKLMGLLGAPLSLPHDRAQLLEAVYGFYANRLARFEQARAYLHKRGIHDPAVIGRMRIGYTPGACLRAYLEGLGYRRETLCECGLIDTRGRDVFFRCLTFPLERAANLYGRSIAGSICRHRFLPGSKGGLYGWAQALAFPAVVVVEGLFDVAALWQAGFPNAVAALGSHLNNGQIAELCRFGQRMVYICFDADRNGSGQRAAHRLSVQLRHAGIEARRVGLPDGHDPAGFFAHGATAGDFRRCLDRARP